jgi:hypothetical protein
MAFAGVETSKISRRGLARLYFFEQSSTIPVDGVGQEAVQIPPVRMLGEGLAPLFDRHMAEAMISPAPHSEVHPIEPHALLSTDLA